MIDNYSDYYNLRKEQESEYEESLRLDQEKEKNKIVDESEEDLEPELTIEQLRLARLKALDKNYIEEKPKPKRKRVVKKVKKLIEN